MRKFLKFTFLVTTVVIAAGYLIPEKKAMPCCTPSDYNHQVSGTGHGQEGRVDVLIPVLISSERSELLSYRKQAV